jgi:hypothetical protein
MPDTRRRLGVPADGNQQVGGKKYEPLVRLAVERPQTFLGPSQRFFAPPEVAAEPGLYRQIREFVTTDAPLVFVHYETLHYLMNKNVVGSAITPTLSVHMEKIGFSG